MEKTKVKLLQKESPNMGIESVYEVLVEFFNFFTCKKSPQTWGLKVNPALPKAPCNLPVLQKESPNMGIERTILKNCAYVVDCLAKRVPKHGD